VSPELVLQLAEEVKYGSVDAPFGAVAVGAVVVTGIALASTFFFKSGFEAQEEIAVRDKGTFNKKRPPPPKRK
jgi:hypothetical protein